MEDYILSTDDVEQRRLQTQHLAWLPTFRAVLERAGLQAGEEVLDLGCGPGTTSVELAKIVGAKGRVVGFDTSEVYLLALESKAKEMGLSQLESHRGQVEAINLPSASFDCVYGRWILSWPAQVDGVIESVARILRPGGRYVLQEYLDWGSLKMLPHNPIFDGAISACMESWRRGGGSINIAQEIPALAHQAGLEIESFEVVAKVGRPNTAIWQWMSDFYASYLPRLEAAGDYEEHGFDLAAFKAEWARLTADPKSLVLAPVMADIILRKPQ